MSPSQSSKPKSLLQNSARSTQGVSLKIYLSAIPSSRLTHEIGLVLKRTFEQPFTFLGHVGESFELDLHLSDPGLVATEAVARRLLKITGVKRLKAERTCAHRGTIYKITMKN